MASILDKLNNKELMTDEVIRLTAGVYRLAVEEKEILL